MSDEIFAKDLTDDDIKMVAYLQLRDIRKKKIPMKERIHMIKSSLDFNCSEAFGLLGMELRDNFKKLDHYNRMDILEALERSKIIGCIEPLLDILENFDTIEPKSRYLYEQISKTIDVIGRSKKKWLILLLTKYTKISSRLIRESAQNAISKIKSSDDTP